MAISKFIEDNRNIFEPIIKWVKEITKMGTVYTHSGLFHADETACLAFLRIFGYDGEYRRVRELPPESEGCMAFDIGLGPYDHHQAEPRRRESGKFKGKAYASLGLIIQACGILKIPGFETWDSDFVAYLDQGDTSEGPKGEIARHITKFNPGVDENLDVTECFEDAVLYMRLTLEGEIRDRLRKYLSEKKLVECINTAELHVHTQYGDLIVLPCFLYWQTAAKELGLAGVIFPSDRDPGYWNVVVIDQLQIAESDCKRRFTDPLVGFVHPMKFMAVLANYEEAIRVAERIQLRPSITHTT